MESLFKHPELEEYAKQHSKAEPHYLQELERETYDKMQDPQMVSGRLSGRFLKLLVQLRQPQTVVEVGTFTGYSALSMAEGLGVNAKIITLEFDEKHAHFARKHIEKSPFADKIEIKVGPALQTLETIDGPIDLAFIDADKTNYKNYYEHILSKMNRGGLIVLDNCLWSGTVLNPQTDSAKAIDEVNRFIAQDERVDNVILTVRDGLHLAVKR